MFNQFAQQQRKILFYSNYCKYSQEFRRLVSQTSLRNAFKEACIDPVPGTTKRPAWVKKYSRTFLKKVPAIVVGNDVYIAEKAFQWLKQKTGIQTQKKELEGGTKVAGFKPDEMMGTADQWSFVDGSYTQGEFVNLEEEPPLQKSVGIKSVMDIKVPRGAQLPDPVGPKSGWNPDQFRIPKPQKEPKFKKKDYSIKKQRWDEVDMNAFKPVRPKRQIDFRMPQMLETRKGSADEMDKRMQQLMMERDIDYAPSNGPHGGRKHRHKNKGYREI